MGSGAHCNFYTSDSDELSCAEVLPTAPAARMALTLVSGALRSKRVVVVA